MRGHLRRHVGLAPLGAAAGGVVFLGREIGEQRNYSEAVAEEIDSEVRSIVTEAYERARKVVLDHRAKLDAIAHKLMDVETLDSSEFRNLLAAA